MSYPVAAEIEESLTRFAGRELALPDSPLRLLVEGYQRDQKLRALSDGFRERRGERAGDLAARPFPLPIDVEPFHDLDSADLLSVLITPYREGPELVLEADVLDSWLREGADRGDHAHEWDEWRAFARLVRAAADYASSNPDVAVLFDG